MREFTVLSRGLRRTLYTALLLVVVPGVLSAQRVEPPQRESHGFVRVAKWTLLAASAGFAAYALVQSRDAERAYGDLYDRCYADNSVCTLESGHYANPDAEALFQRAVNGDHHARVGIIGGQVALLGSAALFIVDLRNTHGPRDIPYHPARLDRGIGAGISLPF